MKTRTRIHNLTPFNAEGKIKKEVAESPKTLVLFCILFWISTIAFLIFPAAYEIMFTMMFFTGFLTFFFAMLQYMLYISKYKFKKIYNKDYQDDINLYNHHNYYSIQQNKKDYQKYKNGISLIFFVWFGMIMCGIIWMFTVIHGFLSTLISAIPTVAIILFILFKKRERSLEADGKTQYYSVKLGGRKYHHDRKNNKIFFY